MAELFARYEINREPRWPLVSKILVGSLIFHLLVGVVLNYVPIARTIFGVSSSAFGIEVVSEDYERTIIKDDVTMLLAGGRFQYPEGYFSNENSGLLPSDAPPVPVIIAKATPLPPVAKVQTPVPLPKGQANGAKSGSSVEPNIKPVPLPSLSGEVTKVQPTPRPSATPAPSATPPPSPKEAANKKLDEIAKQNNVPRPRKEQLNLRPFDDLWKRLNQEQAQRPLDWKANAEVVLAGRRAENNRWQELRVVRTGGDPALIDFLKSFVAAGGESGALQFLQGPSDFVITLRLDGQKFTARVEALTISPAEATRLAKVYSGMLLAARIAKRGDKEEVYFSNSFIKAEGATLLITMSLGQQEAQTLITEQLAAAAKKTQAPPVTETPLK